MFSLLTHKYLIISGVSLVVISGSFLAGRYTSKKTTEIQYKDKIVYVKDQTKNDKKDSTKKQDKNKEKSGHVVVVTTKTHNKDGTDQTVTKKTIDFNNKEKDKEIANTKENKETDTHIQKDEIKEEAIKKTQGDNSNGIEYRIMFGRSFSDSKIKILPEVGFPLFFGIKGNIGFQTDKTMYAGLSINY